MPLAQLIILALGMAVGGAALSHDDKHRAQPRADFSKVEEHSFGRAADPKAAKRSIRVEMTDRMRFVPDSVRVRVGEAVRFVPSNKGQMMHEMVLGTLQELKKHAELMKMHPGMEHDEPHMAHVAPGKNGEIGWRFTRPGTYYYACLIPGHFEAGMIGKVEVVE